MKNRFDLENEINSLWSSASDLKTIAEMMYDSDFIYNDDRTHTVLMGLAEIIEAKLGKLEDTFNQVYELNDYAPQHVKELRESYWDSLDKFHNQETMTEEKWTDFFDALDRDQPEDQEREGM
jgi:hypothetical protein